MSYYYLYTRGHCHQAFDSINGIVVTSKCYIVFIVKSRRWRQVSR